MDPHRGLGGGLIPGRDLAAMHGHSEVARCDLLIRRRRLRLLPGGEADSGIGPPERLGIAPFAAPAVEDVRADAHRAPERRRPPGPDIVGVIMGGEADRAVDSAGQSGRRHLPRLGPGAGLTSAPEGAVAGETELAAGAAVRPLVDHSADALRESRVADSVQDHLRDGALAFEAFRAGLVIDRRGEAAERRGGVAPAARAEDERRRGLPGGDRLGGRQGNGLGESDRSGPGRGTDTGARRLVPGRQRRHARGAQQQHGKTQHRPVQHFERAPSSWRLLYRAGVRSWLTVPDAVRRRRSGRTGARIHPERARGGFAMACEGLRCRMEAKTAGASATAGHPGLDDFVAFVG